MHHAPFPIWRRFRCIVTDCGSFVNSAQCFGIIVTVQLQPVVESLGLYLLNYVIILFLSNISCFQLCQMFYRGQLCELDFQIFDHGVVVHPPKFSIRFTPLAIHQVCTDLNLPASDALDRTSWRAVATAATHACATC